MIELFLFRYKKQFWSGRAEEEKPMNNFTRLL